MPAITPPKTALPAKAPLDERVTGARGGALDTLRPMAAVAAGIMFGFIFYNLYDFDPAISRWVVAHDIVCVIVCACTWWMIRAGRVREEHAHAVAAVMIVLIATNILFAMWLTRDPYNMIYLDVLVIGAGAGITSLRWSAIIFSVLSLLAVPVLRSIAEPATALRYLITLAATTAVAVGLIRLRVRNLRALAVLTEIDRRQRTALHDLLADLDAKVAQRTAELQAANDALQAQMMERERAETEARRLGEQLLHAQRLESLGRLAGGVAHDFNNLLTVIEGNLRLLADDLPARADRELLDDAVGASQRAAHLTKQLLAFGRKQRIDRSVFDAGKKIEDLARMLERLVGEAVTLHVAANGDGLWVNADPNQLEQVLMNLTLNARDAMPKGGTLHVEVDRVRSREADFVRLRVRDSGVGMDADTRAQLFEPFFTTKEPGKGTGLGLSTVYGIVQQHGGFVDVVSSPGNGSTFDVLLPAAAPLASAPKGASSAAAMTSGTETVLLVEDEDAVRRVAERFLRRLGYEVLVASGGAEAIAIVGRLGRPLDLLFTDVMMPGMDGRELTERLRALQPGLKVLFVSGYTGDYLQTQTGELPAATHFLYKPYEPSKAARLIRDILDGRAAAT